MSIPIPESQRPGPHPENQKKRRELRGPRHALIVLLLVVAGVAIARDLGIGAWIQASSALLALLAACQVTAALALAIHHRHARMLALAAALFAIGWAICQIAVMAEVTWFRFALLAVGALEAFFVAGCTPRDPREDRSWWARRVSAR